jgi:excisionase family DNA binding protein
MNTSLSVRSILKSLYTGHAAPDESLFKVLDPAYAKNSVSRATFLSFLTFLSVSVPEPCLHFKQMQEPQAKEEVLLKTPVEQEWISYPDAQRYSGLSHTTLWRYVSANRLKAARVGRSVRIHLPTLREFMERASEETVEK